MYCHQIYEKAGLVTIVVHELNFQRKYSLPSKALLQAQML